MLYAHLARTALKRLKKFFCVQKFDENVIHQTSYKFIKIQFH